MDSNLSSAISATDMEARYDECAKKLLANKKVLAHILVKTVEEFKEMQIDEVIPLIEGEPLIGKVYVDPGVTNAVIEKDGKQIIGLNTENSEIHEGLIRYDIFFYVLTKNGRSRIIINVEAQMNEPSKYGIVNRAIFYSCRMISSQKSREFEKSNYDDIKQTYSIWIIMNQAVNSMNHIHLVDEPIIDAVKWKGNLDLINIIFLGISNIIPEYDEMYDLHRLLGTLLSDSMESSKKIEIMEKEYSFSERDSYEEVVNEMCNLSSGIREKAVEEGMEKGMEKGKVDLISSMLGKGYKPELISEMTDIPLEKIEKISENLSQAG